MVGMKGKRGTDHMWQLVRYPADIAIYAECRCGFKYACSHSKRNGDGSWSVEQEVDYLYPYCPICGARKKWQSKDIRKEDKHYHEREY